MPRIDITHSDYPSFKPKFDALVVGAKYPLRLTMTHTFKAGLVLPIIGVYDMLERDAEHVLTIQSEQQAWDLIAQLSHLASLHKIDKIASIATAGGAKAGASVVVETKNTGNEVKV